MRQLDQRIAVITGASRGIGRATAFNLGRAGCRVILIARDSDELSSVVDELLSENIDANFFSCDLSDADATVKTFNDILTQYACIDILVNSAGVGKFGRFHEMSIEEIVEPQRVPTDSALIASRLALPGMIANSCGHIVNILTPGSYFALPYLVAYTVSRWGLLGFTRALREEVSQCGIGVSSVCPAWVNTDYIGNNNTDADWLPNVAHIFPTIEPDDVAIHVLRAIRKNKKNVVMSWRLQFFVSFYQHFPRLAVGSLKLIGAYQPRRHAKKFTGLAKPL
ncbi:MAG: SDR family NAD(P)-dependent oxidoreductase [Gammaproteobacteria bacterium]|nr:SDR family NAD(P)-dependent oxidoreductase [Gammaproteobacteria bacterium]